MCAKNLHRDDTLEIPIANLQTPRICAFLNLPGGCNILDPRSPRSMYAQKSHLGGIRRSLDIADSHKAPRSMTQKQLQKSTGSIAVHFASHLDAPSHGPSQFQPLQGRFQSVS